VHKSETNDQDENGVKLWGWWLSLVGMKLHEIQSLGDNYRCLKEIRRIRIKIKFVRS
jgi:hypothetical protein